MKTINYGKKYPLDYIRHVHQDFMTDKEMTHIGNAEYASRRHNFKLMVVRKLLEVK
jgi:hypothetical protein